MTPKVILNALTRDVQKDKPNQIRAAGFIPAELYGSGAANRNLKIKKLDFSRAFELAGEFNLIDLMIDGKDKVKAIIKDVQKNPVKNNILHVDLYQVDMHKKITTDIPLNFIGESAAVAELGGTLVKNMDRVEVHCLPGDLVSHIDVDIAKIKTFADFIRLEDLTLPDGMELASQTNEVVVGAEEVKEEQAAKPAEAEAAAPAATEAVAEEKAEAKK